ncbi:hypothetical protein AG1IA_07351 [Rhizoctonia solani AG-1 IA]|uniref:Uncharacterized protein n=1 Tax=Thanatephorus cucumeris (strain AG1-IA) TaxID=983506 RepID=L8WQK3_THACA|nr:hypothetical protein AG1IA_07351 [Rhizoctonia solani AG-1 IA]
MGLNKAPECVWLTCRPSITQLRCNRLGPHLSDITRLLASDWFSAVRRSGIEHTYLHSSQTS